MANHSHSPSHDQPLTDSSYQSIDYAWFATRFESLTERLVVLEKSVAAIQENLPDEKQSELPTPPREYYSVCEFADLVERSEYTVREWCRLERINAEKCETGHGDAKNWKIPAEEIQRYRDHGLLPLIYLR